MRKRIATCQSCGAIFAVNPVGRPWTKCHDCVSPRMAQQRSRREAVPPPSSIPCDDCGEPVAQTRPISGVATLCRQCSGLDSTARRFPCSGCGQRFVRRHRGGPQSSYAVKWLCPDCEVTLKWCRKCDQVKLVEEFSRRSEARIGRVSRCKPCQGFIYQRSDKDHATALKFGITKEDRDDLYKRYNFQCAICGAKEGNALRKSLAIDHDHKCCPGQRSCGRCVRGVLCMSCNVGIGNLRDDPERLRRAAQYLLDFQGVRPLDP